MQCSSLARSHCIIRKFALRGLQCTSRATCACRNLQSAKSAPPLEMKFALNATCNANCIPHYASSLAGQFFSSWRMRARHLLAKKMAPFRRRRRGGRLLDACALVAEPPWQKMARRKARQILKSSWAKNTQSAARPSQSQFSMLREMRLRRTSNTLCGVVCRLLQSQTHFLFHQKDCSSPALTAILF